jgi:hypothetical protein
MLNAVPNTRNKNDDSQRVKSADVLLISECAIDESFDTIAIRIECITQVKSLYTMRSLWSFDSAVFVLNVTF